MRATNPPIFGVGKQTGPTTDPAASLWVGKGRYGRGRVDGRGDREVGVGEAEVGRNRKGERGCSRNLRQRRSPEVRI